jgi:hypothetical protein
LYYLTGVTSVAGIVVAAPLAFEYTAGTMEGTISAVGALRNVPYAARSASESV